MLLCDWHEIVVYILLRCLDFWLSSWHLLVLGPLGILDIPDVNPQQESRPFAVDDYNQSRVQGGFP